MFKKRMVKKKVFLLLVGDLPLAHQKQEVPPILCFALGVGDSGLQRNQVMGPVVSPTHRKQKAHFRFISKISNWAGLYL